MALDIDKLRKEPEGGTYTSPARLYTTAVGELCAEDDPRAAFLLVGEGGQLPAEEARRYGLIEEPKERKGVANKARKGKDES